MCMHAQVRIRYVVLRKKVVPFSLYYYYIKGHERGFEPDTQPGKGKKTDTDIALCMRCLGLR